MLTFEPHSGVSSFSQAEQYVDHSTQTNGRTGASLSSDRAVVDGNIRPSMPSSVHAMGRHAPQSLRAYMALSHSQSRKPVTISGQVIQSRILEGLHEFNNDRGILYMFSLRKNPDAIRINAEITRQVTSSKFSRPSDEEYVYHGNDPARALRHLLKVRPLILDCATALHLIAYKVLLELLGDARFNTYIEETCDGILSISRCKAPPVPSCQTDYYSDLDTQIENLLPPNLQHGDRLWIQGPVDGFAFHPTGSSNGFNVLVDTSNVDQIVLTGFVSNTSPTHGSWSYDGLRDFLLKIYNAPLTLRDFAFLYAKHRQNSQETAPFSAWSFHAAYEWLKKTQPEALAAALRMLNDPNADLDQATSLYPPKAEKIRGVVQHRRIQESFPFKGRIGGG